MRRITDIQKIEALKLAGIIPQARIEGMLKVGHGAVTEQFMKLKPCRPEEFMQGLPADLAHMIAPRCPWIQLDVGDTCLWVDIEANLQSTHPLVVAVVRSMASFQLWIHKGDPRPAIFQALLSKPNTSRKMK